MRGRTAPHVFCGAVRICAVTALRRFFRRRLVPDAPLTRFRHQEQAEHESDRRNGNRVDQRVTEATRRGISRRRDEGHQAAAPAIADVIRHGDRSVADPAGEIFGEERTDRAVHQADIADHDGDDDDRDRIVDIAWLRDQAEPAVQRIIGDRGQQEPCQNHRFAADMVGEPAGQDQRRSADDEPGADNISGGQGVELATVPR